MIGSVNGSALVMADMHMPARGAWVADVVVDTDVPLLPAPRGALLTLDGVTTWVGTVVDQASFSGLMRARIVGGAGGLQTALLAKYYRSVPLRIPVIDTLAAVGESLAPQSAKLDRFVERWARVAGTATEALAAALRVAGGTWRVMPDGGIWFGEDAWLPTPVDVDVVDRSAERRWMTLAAEVASVLPGTTVDGVRVSEVSYHLRPSRFRAEVWAV